jgi:hypothetical protein
VDLTWAKPATIDCASGWELSQEETLSDHLYILMDVAIRGLLRTRGHRPQPRWGREMKLSQWGSAHRDEEFIAVAAIAVDWEEGPPAY